MSLLISLLLATTSTTKLTLTCPEQIETQQEIVSKIDGWHVSKDSPNRYDKEVLKNQSTTTKNMGGQLLGFSSGVPDNMEILAPDGSKKLSDKRRGLLSTWTFTDTEGIYFICAYQETTIRLSKPLPKGYTKCFIEDDETNRTHTSWCEKK
jgi:hypothetical protein